jgi:uncharacterized protein Usg
MNRCPICNVKISDHKLMCWQNWDLVPENQQAQVLQLWRTSLRGRTTPIRNMALGEYLKARDAAIEAVKEAVKV